MTTSKEDSMAQISPTEKNADEWRGQIEIAAAYVAPARLAACRSHREMFASVKNPSVDLALVVEGSVVVFIQARPVDVVFPVLTVGKCGFSIKVPSIV
jgi:hypothetical protein